MFYAKIPSHCRGLGLFQVSHLVLCSHLLALWFWTSERTGWCWRRDRRSTTSTSSTRSWLTSRTVWRSTTRAHRYAELTRWERRALPPLVSTTASAKFAPYVHNICSFITYALQCEKFMVSVVSYRFSLSPCRWAHQRHEAAEGSYLFFPTQKKCCDN